MLISTFTLSAFSKFSSRFIQFVKSKVQFFLMSKFPCVWYMAKVLMHINEPAMEKCVLVFTLKVIYLLKALVAIWLNMKLIFY